MAELVKAEERVGYLEKFFHGQFGRIQSSMPDGLDPARFTRIIVTEFQKNPDLFDCMDTSAGRASVFASVMTAAQLGLEIGAHLGQAFLIPRRDKYAGGARTCNFQLGYQGLIQLAWRSGMLSDIRCRPVYDGEPFTYKDGTKAVVYHEPSEQPKTDEDIRAAYSILTFKDGVKHPEVMWKWELERIVKKSDASAKSPMWRDWKIEGYLKTVLKRALKYVPKSASFRQVQEAVAVDDGITTMSPSVPEFEEIEGVEVPPEHATPDRDGVSGTPSALPDHDPAGAMRSGSPGHYIVRAQDPKNPTDHEWICECGLVMSSQAEKDQHERETKDG